MFKYLPLWFLYKKRDECNMEHCEFCAVSTKHYHYLGNSVKSQVTSWYSSLLWLAITICVNNNTKAFQQIWNMCRWSLSPFKSLVDCLSVGYIFKYNLSGFLFCRDRLTKNDVVGTTYLSLSKIASSGGEVEGNWAVCHLVSSLIQS